MHVSSIVSVVSFGALVAMFVLVRRDRGGTIGVAGSRRIPLAAAVLALGARVAPLLSGYPYVHYIDEGHVARRAATMLAQGSWDPDWYAYPTGPAVAVTGVTRLVGAVRELFGGQAFAASTSPQPTAYYDVVEPPEVLIVGRVLVLVASVVTVYVVARWTSRWLGHTAAVAAGVVAALLPAVVSRAVDLMIDPLAACFATLTLYLAWQLLEEPTNRRALLAGTAAGAGFVAKYPTGAVILTVLTAIWLTSGRSARERLRLSALALGGMTTIAVAVMPSLVTRTSAVLGDLRAEARRQQTSRGGYLESWFDGGEVGPLLLAAGLIGIAILARRPGTRRVVITWVAFALPLLVVLHRFPSQPFRNVLPLLPLVCVGVGASASAMMDLLQRRYPSRRAFVVTSAAGVLLMVPSLLILVPRQWDRAGVADSRTLAVRWLRANATESTRVIVWEELAVLPSILAETPGQIHVMPAAGVSSVSDRADVLVIGVLDEQRDGGAGCRALGDPPRVSIPSGWRAVARFGSPRSPTPASPSCWRSNRQLVVIATPR